MTSERRALRPLCCITLFVALGCSERLRSEPGAATPSEDAGTADVGTPYDAGPCPRGPRACEGQAIHACDGASGAYAPTGVACDASAGELCHAGACVNACEAAAAERSYLGCEYWPTITLNSVVTYDFNFAVAVANPHDHPVRVIVDRGDTILATRDIPARGLETILLPWIQELANHPIIGEGQNMIVPDGAYRLSSTLPVTVYQFNPLEFQSGDDYSYTNDASLLLPTPALDLEYRAVAWPSQIITPDRELLREPGYYGAPGFVAVVATQDSTTVRLRSRANTQPGPDALPALKPGEEGVYTLNRGDVLQVISNRRFYDDAVCTFPPGHTGGCHGGPRNDLTGSAIVADKPIAAFGGHFCVHIPEAWFYCDHLEEQLFPLATWGTSAVALSTEPLREGERNVFRVVSGSASNRIRFEPPVLADTTLEDGEYVEFEHEGAVRVSGTGRLQVVQYEKSGSDVGGDALRVGDPSMGLAIPVEQYRYDYLFLSPPTFTENYVNVVAPLGAAPLLDDAPIPELTAVEGTGLGWVRVPVPSGAHRIAGPQPFGITVHGVAPACSYLYPGGLDLEPLLI